MGMGEGVVSDLRDVAVSIHSLLEGVALPAEDVVAVVAVAGLVAERPHEGLRAVRGPVRPVVERPRVEDHLVEQLRDLHRVARRARPPGLERPAARVRHVAAVVRRVQRLAVPAASRQRG